MSTFGWAMLAAAVAFNVTASIMLKIAAKGGERLIPLRLGWNFQDGGVLALALALGAYALAFIAYMLTLRSIPVSLAYPLITGLTTICIAVVAIPMFGESIGWRGVLGLVLVLGGVTLIVRASQT